MMRRERNRIFFQWQNEKKVAAVLEKQRQECDRERDIGTSTTSVTTIITIITNTIT